MIGARILQLRKKLNLTQAELGKRVGVSKATISLWEKSETKPRGENLLKLARALNCTPEMITEGKQSQKPSASAVPLISKQLIADFLHGLSPPVDDLGPASRAIVDAAGAGPRTFAFIESATGMIPRIAPDDTVYVDPDVKPSDNTPMTGVWLALIREQAVLGVIDHTPAGIVMSFDNVKTGWEAIPITAEQVVGKVVAFTPAWL